MSQIENSLRRAIAELLLGTRDLRSFAVLVAQTLASAGSGDRSAEALAVELELRLAEFSNGDWTLDELKALVRPLVTNYEVRSATVITGSEMRITSPAISTSSQFVGISLVTVPA